MNNIAITPTEQVQVAQLAQKLTELSATELDAAHHAWKQAAHNVTDYQTARRLYLEHLALERAVESKLALSQAWQRFVFGLAFGDLFGVGI